MQMPTGVVLRRTADLVSYPKNARTHTPEQVKQIAASERREAVFRIRRTRSASFRHPDRGNLVRTRLAAGGKEIRTVGPAVKEKPFRRAIWLLFARTLQDV